MADKFEDLRTFVAIVDSGGVNAAAARIGIAKSAVSRRLSELEARLGTTLIDRSTRSFAVTSVGRQYFEGASDILRALDRLDGEMASTGGVEAVTVSADTAVLIHLVVPALGRLATDVMAASVRLVAGGQPAHVTVAADDEPTSNRTAAKAGTTTDALCASPAYLREAGTPGSAAELAGHSWVVVDGATANGIAVGGATVPPRSVTTVPDLETALAACVAGLGVARLPDHVASGAIGEGRLVRLTSMARAAKRDITIAVAPDAPPASRRLADLLRRGIRDR